tara:strand:+ start:279 stop:779 length:501 start_codon:yes stop_codon:yes gene_type:complete
MYNFAHNATLREREMTSKDNSKAALIDSLNGLLADTLALYVKTKNFHWHVRGPQFRSLHLLFDEQAAEIFALTDMIAERVRKLGGTTLTSIGSIAAKTTIKNQDDTGLDAMAMVKELFDDNTAYVGTLKAAKELAGEAGDNATDGLLDDWTDQAEERAWFLREILA